MKYNVTLPITGTVFISDIEADSEEEAIEKAMEANITTEDIEEWNTHERIVEGNVFRGMQNEAEAQEAQE